MSIQISQGSAATDLRRNERLYNFFFRCSSKNATVKELLQLLFVLICQSYREKKTAWIFIAQCICDGEDSEYTVCLKSCQRCRIDNNNTPSDKGPLCLALYFYSSRATFLCDISVYYVDDRPTDDRPRILEISNGDISATVHPIHFVFGFRVKVWDKIMREE